MREIVAAWRETFWPHATTQRRNEKLKKEISDQERNCQAHYGCCVSHPPDWWNNGKTRCDVAALRETYPPHAPARRRNEKLKKGIND
jgi:hypothetical protein